MLGRRREMGLGPWPDVTIAGAREQAAKARRIIRDGRDPIEERLKRKQYNKRLTLAEAVAGCFEARQAELKDDGKAGRWLSPLELHVLPKIGKHAVEDIDQHIIKQTLEQIWHTKADITRKAINRLNLTLKHAAALGLDVDMQATMKAGALMGKQRHEVTHIPSMSYAELPAFYRWLSEHNHMSCLALRFLILTITSTSEVRLASFKEIEGGVWHIPASRTKTDQQRRIPLCHEAQSIMTIAQETGAKNHIFTASTGKPLSDAAMSQLMIRKGLSYGPHGFRATFRTWVEEQTDMPFEVKEAALGQRSIKALSPPINAPIGWRNDVSFILSGRGMLLVSYSP